MQGFSMVKIHFLQKCSKNGLVSEKNNFIFSSSRGGGPDPKVEFSTPFLNPTIKGLIFISIQLHDSSIWHLYENSYVHPLCAMSNQMQSQTLFKSSNVRFLLTCWQYWQVSDNVVFGDKTIPLKNPKQGNNHDHL